MAKKKVHASRKASGKSGKKKHSKPAVRSRKTRRPAAETVASSAALAAAMGNLTWVHAMLEKLIDSIPPEHALHQPSPIDNHLLWTLGHMATAYSWFATLLDGKPADLPAEYENLFNSQSKPFTDAGAYPPYSQVRRAFGAAYQRVLDAAATLKPADLSKPTVASSHGFAENRHEALLRIAWHDGWHSGQISSIRRSLGLPKIM